MPSSIPRRTITVPLRVVSATVATALPDGGAGVPAPVAADRAAVDAEVQAGGHQGIVGGQEAGGRGMALIVSRARHRLH
jgi:hypothetical protein